MTHVAKLKIVPLIRDVPLAIHQRAVSLRVNHDSESARDMANYQHHGTIPEVWV